MVGVKREEALSEIIGFILIIAIIVIIMSLYLTYVVPAQGREKEIDHMQDVERFFTDIKINMDSLWLNNQVGVPFNQILTLGTGGLKTSGSFSVFGIMQPSPASGTVTVSGEPEMVLTVNGLWKGGTLANPAVLNTIQINTPHTPLNINYRTGAGTQPYSLLLQSTKGDWTAMLQVQKEEYLSAKNISFDMDPQTKAVSNLKITQNPRHFVTLTVTKEGIQTLDNLVISSNLKDIGGVVLINLLDEAYGLNADVEFPFGVTYQYYDAGGVPVTLGSPFTVSGFSDETRVSNPVRIGSLKYESSNKYWLNQNYSYQLGGVFLGQGGTELPRINPWIKVQNSTGSGGAVSTSIVDISLHLVSLSSGNSRTSGPDSVQITSKVLGISDNFSTTDGKHDALAEYRPNARYVKFRTRYPGPDPYQTNSWFQTYDTIFRNANIPAEYYAVCRDPNNGFVDVKIWGADPSPPPADPCTATDAVLAAGDPDLYIDYSLIETEVSVSSPIHV